MSREPVAESVGAASRPRTGAQRPAKPAGRVFLGQALEIAERNRQPVLLGQAWNFAVQDLESLALGNCARGR